jgi:prevent-host-death family protein
MNETGPVNVHDAKTHLSKLLERVASGEEIVLARAGKPVAKLVPLDASRKARTPGLMKGRIRIAADFDAPLPADVLERFEGRGR